jgi:hypothetical protein
MTETDPPPPLALNIDRSGWINFADPPPTSPFLPKSPLMGLHYPKTKEQIGVGVGANTRSQTSDTKVWPYAMIN